MILIFDFTGKRVLGNEFRALYIYKKKFLHNIKYLQLYFVKASGITLQQLYHMQLDYNSHFYLKKTFYSTVNTITFSLQA